MNGLLSRSPKVSRPILSRLERYYEKGPNGVAPISGIQTVLGTILMLAMGTLCAMAATHFVRSGYEDHRHFSGFEANRPSHDSSNEKQQSVGSKILESLAEPQQYAVLSAEWRRGLKDLQNAVLNPWNGVTQTHEEPGTIGTPRRLKSRPSVEMFLAIRAV